METRHEQEHESYQESGDRDGRQGMNASRKGVIEFATLIMLAMGLVLLGLNTYQIGKLKNPGMGSGMELAGGMGVGMVAGGNQISGGAEPGMEAMTGNAAAQTNLQGIDVTPKGTPEIYGKELGVNYDDVSVNDQSKADKTINKLGLLDKQITLSGSDKERYISIASQISCEYCCGAESVINSDGSAACGCSHSFAMRGLAKYLIKNHASEFTDDEILGEMGKWKVLFFPGIHAQKAAVLKSKGVELSFINLASNKYRGAENEAPASGAAMVGGC